MTKKKILILGASGFMGRNLLEYFLAKDSYEVHAVSFSRVPPFNAPGLTWWAGDLCDRQYVDLLLAGTKPDILIQAAAASSGCKDTLNDPAMHIAKNGVMNSLIFPAAVKAGVKHVIFPSCSVMCASRSHAQTEAYWDASVPLNPAYLGFASTKIYCEKLCEFYANISDTKFTVFRNTNFYGPYDKYDLEHSHVFGATITKVMQAQDKITIWGTGEEARDFVHIDDFCRITEAAIIRQEGEYELYNCGSGKALPIKELVATIIRLSGKNLTVEHDLTAPTIPTSLCLDTSKARKELIWHPKVSIKEGILRTLAWWKENCK